MSKSTLLGAEHSDTNVAEILEQLAKDDMAFYDPAKRTRKVPIFAYDDSGEPTAVRHWNTRYCAPEGMTLVEAQLKGLDVHIEGRGWIRSGKKAERDFRG